MSAAQLACVSLPFMSAPDDEWRRGAPRAWHRSVVTDRGSLRWLGLTIIVLVGFMVVAMLWHAPWIDELEYCATKAKTFLRQ